MNNSPIVILIHGFTSKKEDIINIAYKLSNSGFNVNLFELAYHGSKSPKNKKDWLYRTISQSVKMLEKMINSLKYEDIYILGVSLGSIIADMLLEKNYLNFPNLKKIVYMLYNPKKIDTIKKIKSHKDLSFYLTEKSYLKLEKKLSIIIPSYHSYIKSYIINGKNDPWIPYKEANQYLEIFNIKYDVVSNVGHDVSEVMINMAIDFLS